MSAFEFAAAAGTLVWREASSRRSRRFFSEAAMPAALTILPPSYRRRSRRAPLHNGA